MTRLRSLIGLLGIVALAGMSLCRAEDNNALKLWYRQPASAWTQALPVGNGRLAAMVFGVTAKEHLQLNEDTIWSGKKRDRSNLEAPKSFPEVRRLLLEGHPALAQALADRTRISVPRALPVYQTLGDLWLDFGAATPEEAYRRGLDPDTGIASISYTAGGGPADKPGSLSFRATITRPADATGEAAPGRLILTGQALPKNARGENNTGVRFRAEMKAAVSGGHMESAGDHLGVAVADSVTLTIVASVQAPGGRAHPVDPGWPRGDARARTERLNAPRLRVKTGHIYPLEFERAAA